MFNRKNSNLLFLPMPKPIKDSTPDYTEIRTARNQSLEKQLRKLSKNTTYLNRSSLLQYSRSFRKGLRISSIQNKYSKQKIIKCNNFTITQKQSKISNNNNSYKIEETKLILCQKLLNAQAIINDEPQQMIEPRIYNPYFRSPSVLPSHLKDTYFDPDKYQNFYDKLSKNNLKVNHQVRAAILNYRKQISSKQQRVPNFLKLVQ